MAGALEEFIEHFGVKGMRWGKSKGPKETPSADASRSKALRTRAKRSSPKALTNAELQDAINRMNLEQQFKRLSVNERNVATRFVASTLMEIGQREVKNLAVKSLTSVIKR